MTSEEIYEKNYEIVRLKRKIFKEEISIEKEFLQNKNFPIEDKALERAGKVLNIFGNPLTIFDTRKLVEKVLLREDNHLLLFSVADVSGNYWAVNPIFHPDLNEAIRNAHAFLDEETKKRMLMFLEKYCLLKKETDNQTLISLKSA